MDTATIKWFALGAPWKLQTPRASECTLNTVEATPFFAIGSKIVRNTSTIQLCFIATILLGFGFLVLGFIIVPIRASFQLDAVLTPQEWADDAIRESTFALLKKASGNEWSLWVIGGGIQFLIGIVGLCAEIRHNKTDHSMSGKGK